MKYWNMYYSLKSIYNSQSNNSNRSSRESETKEKLQVHSPINYASPTKRLRVLVIIKFGIRQYPIYLYLHIFFTKFVISKIISVISYSSDFNQKKIKKSQDWSRKLSIILLAYLSSISNAFILKFIVTLTNIHCTNYNRKRKQSISPT